MIRPVILAIALATAANAATENDHLIKTDIVGGSEVPNGQYPWVVALVDKDYDDPIASRQFCGGSLIAPNFILTAVHCIEDEDLYSFEIAVGSADLRNVTTFVEPYRIFIHPDYKEGRISRGMDIALIQLRDPIEGVEPIDIDRALDRALDTGFGRALGWGRTSYDSDDLNSPNRLRVTDLNLAEITGYPSDHPVYSYCIMADDIDPVRGTFSGDSGGPFIIQDPNSGDWLLAGVTSYGVRVIEAGFNESYFARVSAAASWIDSIVNPPFATAPEVQPADRVAYIPKQNGELAPALKIWPFQANNYETTQSSDRPYNNSFFSTDFFDLLHPETYRYAGEGSFWQFQSLYTWRNGYGFARFKSNPAGKNLSNGISYLSPSKPNNGLTTFNTGYGPYQQTTTSFELRDLQPNIEYTVRDPWDSPFKLFEFAADSFLQITDSDLSNSEKTFIPDADKSYLLVSDERSSYEFALYPSPQHTLKSGKTTRASLTASSPLFQTHGAQAETIENLGEGLSYDEVIVSVNSEFDAELSFFDKYTAKLSAYNDLEAENATDTCVLSFEDYVGSYLRVLNFDANVFGNFSVTVKNFTTPTPKFDVEQRRAVTRHDESYVDSNGRTVYYDLIRIANTPNHSYLKATLNSHYFNPGVAVYEDNSNDDILFEYGESFYELEWDAENGTTYEILVFSYDPPHNINYDIEITGSDEPTVDSTPSPTPPASLYSKSDYKDHFARTALDQKRNAASRAATLRDLTEHRQGLR